MDSPEAQAIRIAAAKTLADVTISVAPLEFTEWSRVYGVTRPDGGRVYAKGVPRTRPEARVTAALWRLCPEHVPRVLCTDLIPADPLWHWFLLADAGRVLDFDASEPTILTQAIEAVTALGRLQRKAAEASNLAELVPRCEPGRFRQIIEDIVEWAASGMPDEATLLRSLGSAVVDSRALDRAIQVLGHDSTLVHGDLWYGNVAISDVGPVILDWGDAVWGAAGVSVVNFLQTADGKLDACEADLWRAWGEGIGMRPTEDYMWACEIAHGITSIVVDREIARCCGRPACWLQGLVPALEWLARRLSEG